MRDRIFLYEALLLVGLVFLAYAVIVLGGCSPSHSTVVVSPVSAVGTYQATQTDGGEFIIDTRDGHGYIVLPEGVVDLGVPTKPTLEAIPRSGLKRQAPRTVTPDSTFQEAKR